LNRRPEHPQSHRAPERRDGRVLSVGKIPELLFERNNLLRAAGYKVNTARTAADAMALLGRPHQVVIFGHAVPEDERNLIAAAARASYPKVKIIMLYMGAIQKAELADALLSANGNHDALLRALEHLLDGPAKSSAEAS
jgi:DNA-binding NtrC family response regulator